MTVSDLVTIALFLAAHAGLIVYGVGRILLRHEIRLIRIETRLAIGRSAGNDQYGEHSAEQRLRL
ncbi:MAG: hypothetical protein WCA78_15735 [Rhizomicrobium sp.]